MIWEKRIEVKTETGCIRLRYFVTPPQKENDLALLCYGIGVAGEGEHKEVAAFSPDREEAISLMKRLCRMRVTPTTFFEVLDDYLATR